jgi:hypothetical protein
MSDKLNKFDIFNNLAKLSKHMETAQKTELLELFASYVYLTNPDYKYNETYLRDMIPAFWNNIEKYTDKVCFREKLIDELEKVEISDEYKCQLCIQIDETWGIEFNSLSEKKWKREILKTPNLNAVDREKIYVKCQFSNGQNTFYTDYKESKDTNELIQFVISSVKSFVQRLGKVKNG